MKRRRLRSLARRYGHVGLKPWEHASVLAAVQTMQKAWPKSLGLAAPSFKTFKERLRHDFFFRGFRDKFLRTAYLEYLAAEGYR